jgi:hypothetical protein
LPFAFLELKIEKVTESCQQLRKRLEQDSAKRGKVLVKNKITLQTIQCEMRLNPGTFFTFAFVD